MFRVMRRIMLSLNMMYHVNIGGTTMIDYNRFTGVFLSSASIGSTL